MALSRKQRERMTVAQRKKTAETRDCPECSGMLDRTDIWGHERAYTEEYVHKSGDPDCSGNSPDRGFWKTQGNLVTHYRGYTEGTGVFSGEFR